jgi:predicted ArsR family transcriptional regulator
MILPELREKLTHWSPLFRPRVHLAITRMPPRGFSTAKRLEIAALLRSKPMSLFELRDRVGGDKTTLKRTLTSLRKQGFVGFQEEVGHTAPGTHAGLWFLTAGGVAAVGAAQALEDEAGVPVLRVRSGQTWVRATVPDKAAADLRRAAAQGDLAPASSCVLRLDGGRRTYLFVFTQEMGSQPAENLVASLEALGLKCTLEVVGPLQSPDLFVDSAKVAIAAAHRTERQRS